MIPGAICLICDAQVDTFKHVYAMPHYITYNPQDDPKATPHGRERRLVQKGVINQNIGYDGANRNVPPLTKIE